MFTYDSEGILRGLYNYNINGNNSTDWVPLLNKKYQYPIGIDYDDIFMTIDLLESFGSKYKLPCADFVASRPILKPNEFEIPFAERKFAESNENTNDVIMKLEEEVFFEKLDQLSKSEEININEFKETDKKIIKTIQNLCIDGE